MTAEEGLHRLAEKLVGKGMWQKLWAKNPTLAVRAVERRIDAERHQLMAFWQAAGSGKVGLKVVVKRRS